MNPGWPSDAPDRDALVEFMGELGDAARAVVRGAFRGPVEVRYKPDRSPVTEVDRRVEAVLRDLIELRYPGHGIVGEELGGRAGDRINWVIDPIDGTKSFMTGQPLFGTLVALVVDGVPVLGMLEVPALEERWIGARGEVTRVNGAACATSARSAIGEASLHSTTIDMFPPDAIDGYERLSGRVRLRMFGGDCYNYGLLSSGFVDLVVEASLKQHDFLALVPIVEGAGGRMTDWSGASLTFGSAADRVLAAANPDLHAAALALLSGPPRE